MQNIFDFNEHFGEQNLKLQVRFVGGYVCVSGYK